MKKRGTQEALFDFYGRPGFGQALPLALQHVVAAVVGIVTPAIIVAGAANLGTSDKVLLIQAALVVSGLTTLLQLFPVGRKKGTRIGASLPVIMGVSFAYVPSMQAIGAHESGDGVAMILGAQIVGGIVAVVVGLSVALGMGITQANNALASFPDWATMIFGKSPVVVATCMAVLLNLVLPKGAGTS